MLLARVFISSSPFVVILYFWLKSRFDIFCAILLNSKIGSVNFLEIIDITIAEISITNPAIIIKKLFDIFTLSCIDVIGIRTCKK